MKRLLFTTLFLLSIGSILGQTSRRIIVQQNYLLENGKNLDSVEIDFVIPKTYKGRQIINKISYSVYPKYTYNVKDATYVHFALDKRDLQKTDSISVKIDMTLTDYDLIIAQEKSKPEKLTKSNRKRYLKNTGLYELVDISKPEGLMDFSVTGEIDLANEIHDFVVNHLSYQTFFGKDKGAKYAMRNGKGDCTEYADLMIALCRSNNLPARRISGFVVQKESNDLLSKIFKYSSHAWVEVYFNGLGWVPFDPTHSDGSHITNFENLKTKYVYYSYDVKTKNFKGSWVWWGSGPFNIKTRTLVKDYN